MTLKAVHILAAAVFLGGGAMSAYYKLRADRSGDPRVIAWFHRELIRADWVFTLPSALVLPATGVTMVMVHGYELSTEWILAGIVAYAIAGACWLPAMRLQYRMSELADEAVRRGEPLPEAFYRATRVWVLLGIPAFAASVLAVWAMAAKRALPG